MPDLIAFLTVRIEEAGLLAPLLAALVGVVLTLAPRRGQAAPVTPGLTST